MENIISVSVENLRPHPFNVKLYNDDLREEEFAGLEKSITEHGIKEPLIVKACSENELEFTILSGHRRWKVATTLGIKTLPCIVEECDNDEISIIEHNRYRKKTMSELMREAEFLMESEKERSADNRRFKTAVGGGGRTTARVAKALGIGSHTQMSKLQKIYTAAKTDEKVALQMKEIDGGVKSINTVFKMLQPKKDREDFGFDLQLYTCWHFPTLDLNLGINHPGRIPGQIVENLMYYYTNPGDFVVDPFGGGGITIDAAKTMNRRALVMDIAPVRADIVKWDISMGFPNEASDCDFIFMDPPYWNMLEKEYTDLSPDSCAALNYDAFHGFLHDLIKSAFVTLKEGGHMAIIMMPQTTRLPEGMAYLDWPFECRSYMDEVGFVPIQRISRRWPTSIYGGSQVIDAKESKQLMTTHGDIIIGRKVT